MTYYLASTNLDSVRTRRTTRAIKIVTKKRRHALTRKTTKEKGRKKEAAERKDRILDECLSAVTLIIKGGRICEQLDAVMDLGPLLLLLLSMFLLLFRQRHVGALKLLDVSVPAYLRTGESARLECRYDLESDKLYSITWSKDNEHIYSYTEPKKKRVFSIEGVTIDSNKSNSQALQLQRVSLNSTGYYACEVYTDTLPFKTVKGEAYMEVIEPPRDDPKITGGEEIYATGDILALNCTSAYSYPPAKLQWFINNVPVDPDLEMSFTYRSLHSIRSSLRLELNPIHLSEGRIVIKCVSTVRSSPAVVPPYVDTRTTKIYVQGHASLSTPSHSLLLVALLMLLSMPRKD